MLIECGRAIKLLGSTSQYNSHATTSKNYLKNDPNSTAKEKLFRAGREENW